jgi:hypothetical protein
LKVLVFLIIGIGFLYGGVEERILLEKVFENLFNKKVIKVYASKDVQKLLKGSVVIKIVKECKKADIIVGNFVDINCSKPVFVFSYFLYKDHSNILGAFYWRKGRPQLRLRHNVIKKYNLFIKDDLKDFLE